MGGRRDDLVEVVLEGDPGSAEPGAGERDGRPRRARRPWSPRRRRASVAAGLVLAAGVVAVRWDAATLRALPVLGVPGLSVSLASPLHLLWEADGQIIATADESTVLVATPDAVEARDAATGDVLWRTPGGAGWCRLEDVGETADGPAGGLPADPSADPSTDLPAARAGEIALCSLDGTAQTALDVATGQVLVTVDVDLQTSSSFLVDGDVVLAGIDRAGRATAARWSTTTGELAWSLVGPQAASLSQGISTQIDGSVITVEWSGGSMTVDASTGALLSTADEPSSGGPRFTYHVTLPDGTEAIQDWAPGAELPDGASVRVLRPDGSELVTIPGYLLRPSVDDAPASGPLLIQDWLGSLTRAYDPSTGAELWAHAISPSLLIDGRLVGTSSPEELIALDVTTGEPLWTQAVPLTADAWGTASDGRRMLSLEGPDLRVVARSLATGREVWSLDEQVASTSHDANGVYAYGPVSVGVMPSGLVLLSGASHAALLGP